MKILKSGIIKFVIENKAHKIYPAIMGWGNGYVGVLKNHPWYGKHYDLIHGVDIHGGLTYSEFGICGKNKHYYIVEFDTNHWNDNLLRWSQSRVEEETNSLYNQALEALSKSFS